MLTVAGLNVGALIGGARRRSRSSSSMPGMGWADLAAIARAIRRAAELIAVIAIIYVLVNFIVDFLYTVLDPGFVVPATDMTTLPRHGPPDEVGGPRAIRRGIGRGRRPRGAEGRSFSAVEAVRRSPSRARSWAWGRGSAIGWIVVIVSASWPNWRLPVKSPTQSFAECARLGPFARKAPRPVTCSGATATAAT